MNWQVRAKARMKELGITQEDLVQALGVETRGAVGHYLSGRRDPSPDQLRALASKLNWSTSQLMDDNDTEHGNLVLAPPRGRQLTGMIQISQVDVTASMGSGAIPPDHVDVVRNVSANLDQLRKLCSFTTPQALQIITGYGNSMSPTINDGDPVLVDTGVSEIKIDGGVYVFLFDGDLFIKRVQRLPGKVLRIISDNRAENDTWDIKPEDMDRLEVKARVVLVWNSRRL